MTPFEFDGQFERLKNQFHVPNGTDQEKLGLEWYEALKHWHVDAVERGITDVIRNAKDRFFPPIGIVREAIHIRLAGTDKYHNKCQTCHGSGWIESWPEMSGGLVYEMYQRCPDCGIPAPEIKKPYHSRPLTKQEYEDWKDRKAHRDIIPEKLKAKKPIDPAAKNEIREFMSNLRDKLFGHTDRYEP